MVLKRDLSYGCNPHNSSKSPIHLCIHFDHGKNLEGKHGHTVINFGMFVVLSCRTVHTIEDEIPVVEWENATVVNSGYTIELFDRRYAETTEQWQAASAPTICLLPSPRHRRFPQPTHASGHRRRAKRMDGSQLSPTHVHAWATPAPTDKPVAEEEEYYSSWSLFLVCVLLILSLWTSYYLQIKRIRVIHETLVSIFAGMFVGLIVRLAPGNMIRDMLVRE